MQKDYITERLKFLTELFKLCWLSVIAIGGGAVSLVVGPFNQQRWAWATVGGVLILTLVAVLWHIHGKMLDLWVELQKGASS